jgi:hypothetical protein
MNDSHKIIGIDLASNKDKTSLSCPYAEAKSQIAPYTECNIECPIVEGYKCKRWDICGSAKRKLKGEQ